MIDAGRGDVSRAERTAQAWAEVSELSDRQLSPLGLAAIESLSPAPGEVIADIGCGAGQSVLQLARRVGPAGRVVGVDIAPRLLELARRRAQGLGQVSFVQADAQDFDAPDDSFDAVFSRSGMMAFADPAAAFANFRRMLRPSGRLAFVCWRSLAENELDLLPVRAAGLEALVDDAPFSLADPAILRRILESAGFEAVELSAHDQLVSSGDAEAMARVLLKVGALGRILRERPELRGQTEPRLRAALVEREVEGIVSLHAAVWVVSAQLRSESLHD